MTSRVVAATEGLDEAASLIKHGGLVAIPTETVYGLGANAFDPKAVSSIFHAKRRPEFDPLIVHVVDTDMLALVTSDVPEVAKALIDRFWPGPLTIVFGKSEAVPPIVTSGLETVAVRMPSHRIALELIKRAGVPIAAPSANTFGQLSPTRAEHVAEDLSSEVDLILDDGSTSFGVESTIIDVTGPMPTLLRFGAVTLEDIEETIGTVLVSTSSSSNPKAPGQLDSHYAPKTMPLRLINDSEPAIETAAYIAFSNAPKGWGHVEVLSPTGDLVEAAARLFQVLHNIDRGNFSAVYAELVPEEGIGRAINDRLKRASS